MTSENFTGNGKGEKIQPQKNAMDDFKGYQLSEGFDYKQNPEKYIPQPPRAGTKNGNNPKRGPDSHKADDLNGLNAHHAQPEESENQSELDVNMVMQRMRKQVDDEPSIDPDLPSNPSNINLAKKRESQKSDKLPALNGKDKKETQANANSKQPVDRREATRNILENNQKLEWEITDRKTAIQKKIDDMEKVKHRSENLPVINVRGASVDPKPQRQPADAEEGKPKHIHTFDKTIKIIGQEKAAHHRDSKAGDYYYPESITAKGSKSLEPKKEHIPNAYERKVIRENIKIILDHNFNVELTNKKKHKPSGKLPPMPEKPNPEPEGIVKFVDKDLEDYEARGKYDRRVFRRRSQMKPEGKRVFTNDDVKDEDNREAARRKTKEKKEPGMVEMIKEIPNDKATADYDKPFYIENIPSKKKNNFEPGRREDLNQRARKGNPDEKFFVVVYLVLKGPDGMGWRSYTYDLFGGTTQIIDLKILVEKDLGYSYQHQHYYFNLREIEDGVDLKHLEFKCDIWSRDCIALIMVPSEEPSFNQEVIPRGKYLPLNVADLYPENGPFAKTTTEFLHSNIMKALIYPPNRDWTEEFYINYKQAKKHLLEVKNKDREVTSKKYLGPKLSETLTRLAIHTKGMQKTINEFEETALKCVEIINKWEVKPHELNFVYGIGGMKWVMGGLVIRECKFLYTMGRKVEESEVIGELVRHKVEMLNWIRSATDNFIVPLTTAFEYYGRYYLVFAAVPIDPNTLVYGTITQNLVVVNDLNDNPALQELAKLLNLNFHYVYESALDNYKPIYVTSNWEIHKVKETFYITDIDRLLPLDFCEESEIQLDTPFIANFLPMEIVQSSVSKNIDEIFAQVRSRDTFRCSECREFIPDPEYYTYEKGSKANPGDEKSMGYNCCIKDYQKKSVYHDLKVSVGKLKKKKFRAISLGHFYVNKQTGEVLETVPYQKVPLNTDIIEAKDIPNEIINQIKNDRLNIKYLSNNLRANKAQEIAEVFQRFEEDVGTCRDISNLMKQRGVPVRYLGKVAENCDKNFAKEIIVREMIARAMAQNLISSFEYLRRVANEMKEFNLKKNIVYHLNNLLGAEMTEDGKLEWKTVIDYIRINFDTVLEINVKDKIHMPGLVLRILELIDTKLLVNLDDIDFTDNHPFKISYFEIFHPRVAAAH